MVVPAGGPVAEIADFRSLLVETDVPEGRLHLVQKGSPSEIVLDAYPERRYRGEVREFGQRVNRAKATVTVKVKFVDTLEGVLPDMAARVSFLTRPIAKDSLNEKPKRIVPGSALVDRGGGKSVFVVEGGKLRLTPVTLGAPLAAGFELVDGPAAGTKIVSGPRPELTDGQSVKEKGIGAMITMYAAVANRQREIGTLRALGFSRSSILGSFLLEAMILALAGGAVGAAASMAMGYVKFSMMNFASWSEMVFSFDPTPGIIVRALAFAGIMGLVGGFFPAVRAARVSPVAAMRG
jgi:hypothetical protein